MEFFLYYWPTLLALVSRAAPAGLKATLMGVVFLTLFISNILIGWIGGLYEHMTPAQFCEAVQAGEFLEHVEYAGHRYGTLRREVDAHLAAEQRFQLA